MGGPARCPGWERLVQVFRGTSDSALCFPGIGSSPTGEEACRASELPPADDQLPRTPLAEGRGADTTGGRAFVWGKIEGVLNCQQQTAGRPMFWTKPFLTPLFYFKKIK